MRWLFLLLAWLCGTAYAAGGDFETRMAQARLFVKKHWYGDAADELELALAMPEGTRSYEAHWLAAQVAWELLDIDWALATARGAAALAPDAEARADAQALVESYEQGFGFLVVEAPYEGMATRMQLELVSLVFDAELKHYINRCALKWRERTLLPARLGLPVGSYTVNGQPVEVSAGREAHLTLPMHAIGARGLAALQVTRAEVSGGMGLLTGTRVTGLLPGPHMQLAVTQPVGRLLLGAFGELTLQGVIAPDNQVEGGLWGWGAGVRVGIEPPSRLPLAVRPSLTVRYAQVPGIALDCTPAGAAWRCGEPSGDATALRIFAVGRALAPGAELSLEYREAGRTTALGTGLKAGVDYALGTFAPGGQTVGDDLEGQNLDWSTDEGWSALGVRLIANISFAF